MKQRKFAVPEFLNGHLEQVACERWLHRRAQAHVKRDRKRGMSGVTGAAYRQAIHHAVIQSQGRDAYTGEELHWHLVSRYRNVDSQDGRHLYKAGFALLPTVDHIHASSLEASFKICAWRTNDAKNDLSHEDFFALCMRVVTHAGSKAIE
ncbi:MAG: hypothetical protein QM808_14325 [Steroidobacteraceae bacterium]